ncbi:KilA-N domain-containing protein [Acinetobacter ursingii]|uniref:KilA-N domain-containing protein n=1 Tax=Acinetobacter ursingii TaxID=108980 RepID=UPI0021CDCAD5|nr:KilA-N domain-containing protein [Acinetobacter ursingii]MCU4483568.1 KilA-N domain-containing protein [Acinetobacter ursingii]MCU4507888.1 KilA-N domain-containing protein [Acinetobacter ursingii]
MKSTDNKKAQNLDGTGFQLSLFRNNDMATIAQHQYNSNSKPLVIDGFSIRQDEEGRYCINDLHKASGNLRKDRPSYFLENEKTQCLIQAIKDENYDVGNSVSYIEPVNIIRGRGKEQGTYVVRELVYSYGMWISAKFHLTVIRAYDAMAANQSFPKTHKSERTPLHEAHALLVAKTKHLNSSDAWKLIHQRFGVNDIAYIPYDQIPVAVEYVHHLIALYSNSEKYASQPNISHVRELVESVLMQNFMLQNVWKGLRALDKKLYLNAMQYVVDSNVSALNVIKIFNLKTKHGKDMISIDFRVINFHSGHMITDCNPNYFNAPS